MEEIVPPRIPFGLCGLLAACSASGGTEEPWSTVLTQVDPPGQLEVELARGDYTYIPKMCVSEQGLVVVSWVAWPAKDALDLHVDVVASAEWGQQGTWSGGVTVHRSQLDYSMAHDMDCGPSGVFVAWSARREQEGTSSKSLDWVYTQRSPDGFAFDEPEWMLAEGLAVATADTQPRIRAVGDRVVAAWVDSDRGRVVASSSQDAGATWTPSVAIDPPIKGVGATRYPPELAVSETGHTVVAFGAVHRGDEQVRVVHAPDVGTTFSAHERLDAATSDFVDDKPWTTICSDQSNAWAVWMEKPLGGERVLVVARSVDGGATWAPPLEVSDPFAEVVSSRSLACAAERATLHLVGEGTPQTGEGEVWYGRLDSLGRFASLQITGWGANGEEGEPRLLVQDGNVLVSWLDDRDERHRNGDRRPYYTMFSSAVMPKSVWRERVPTDRPPARRRFLDVALQDGEIYASWSEEDDATGSVVFTRFLP